jgi:hypothetical protein
MSFLGSTKRQKLVLITVFYTFASSVAAAGATPPVVGLKNKPNPISN